MAGIGFELKRLFEKDGIAARIRAYSYASSVISGPMILGIFLLLAVLKLAEMDGAPLGEREMLLSLLTYGLLFSLITSSVLSVICTRYVADALYLKRKNLVLPSFYGSAGLTLLFGGLLYGTFLLFSGIPFAYQVLSFLFYMTVLFVWIEMTYLSAVNDYKNVMVTFAAAIGILIAVGFVLTRFTKLDTTVALLGAAWAAYGVMGIRYYALLLEYFSPSKHSPFHFLRWIEHHPLLFFLGMLIPVGLYGHLFIMWFSPLQVTVMGWFRGAPTYDVSALVAILSTLITSISFVISVEVRFYPEYRRYFSLLNDGGTITDIAYQEKKMLRVLHDELEALLVKQVIATIFFITIGTVILDNMALGFTGDMLGIFRILCIGYALYAIGNSTMLILLYFEDHLGAFCGAVVLAVSTNVCTFISKGWESSYYGMGFLLGAGLFCLFVYWRLNWYTKNLIYHVIAQQPLQEIERHGVMVQFADRMERLRQTKKHD